MEDQSEHAKTPAGVLGKRFLTGSMELVVMVPSAGPGSGPSWRGRVATQAAPGLMVVPPLWEVKVKQVPPQWEVK